MIRRFALALACALFALPAGAWPVHGAAALNIPNVLPGGQQPTVTNGVVGNITVNDLTPVSHGSSSDYGYALPGWARNNGPPIVEVGDAGVSVTRRFGVFASHPSTDVEMLAGLESNITSAKVRCDGGSWFTIASPANDPDNGNVTDWGFNVTSANFADGLHKCDMVLIPATGPDIVINSPMQDDWGNYYFGAKTASMAISDGGGVNPGNILTISTGTTNWYASGDGAAAISVGMTVWGGDVAAGTFIDGTSAVATRALCGTNCTGAGSVGTYHVTGPAQLVTPAPGEINPWRSIYFVTNYNGTLRGTGPKKLYVCGSASPGCPVTVTGSTSNYPGSDSNNGLSPTTPVLTYGKALALAITSDTSSPTSYRGRWGQVICLMGGLNYTFTGGPADVPSVIGATVYQGASGPDCAVAGDPGTPTLTFGADQDNSLPQHTVFSYLAFTNSAAHSNGGLSKWLVADHVTQTNPGLEAGGIFGSSGLGVFESTAYYGTDGVCSGCEIVRGNTAKYFAVDGINNVPAAINNTYEGGGNIFLWMTADAVSGSNVLTNVTVPAGQTIASIFGTYGNLAYYPANSQGAGCVPGGFNITGTNDAAHTITISASATSSCTAGHLGDATAHSDLVQITGSYATGPLFIQGNSFYQTINGFGQALFLEQTRLKGVTITDNKFRNDPTSSYHVLAVNGLNNEVIYARNLWDAPGAQFQDFTSQANNSYAPNPSKFESFVKDQCVPGTSGYGGYGSVRSVAAATNACTITSTARCTTFPVITQTGTGIGSTVAITVSDAFNVTPTGHTYAWHRATVSTNVVVQSTASNYTAVSADVGNMIYFQDDITSASGTATCVSMPVQVG